MVFYAEYALPIGVREEKSADDSGVDMASLVPFTSPDSDDELPRHHTAAHNANSSFSPFNNTPR